MKWEPEAHLLCAEGRVKSCLTWPHTWYSPSPSTHTHRHTHPRYSVVWTRSIPRLSRRHSSGFRGYRPENLESKGAMEKRNPQVFVRIHLLVHNFHQPWAFLLMEKALDLIETHNHSNWRKTSHLRLIQRTITWCSQSADDDGLGFGQNLCAV